MIVTCSGTGVILIARVSAGYLRSGAHAVPGTFADPDCGEVMVHRTIKVLPDPEELAHEALRRFARAAEEAIEEKNSFAVALSGGNTPRRLHELLAAGTAIQPPP